MVNVGTLNGSLVLDDQWSPELDNSAKRTEEWERQITSQFKQAQQNFNGSMTAMGKNLQSFGDDALKIGGVLSAAITLPLTMMAKQAITTGMTFESSINKINGVLTPTSDQMERIRAKAMEMGAATIFSATESADAMLELGKAGFSVENALAGVDDVLQLAAASGMSMADSAALAARTLNAFGLDVTDLAHVNDVLAKAVNTTSLEIDDLRLGFQYVGPIAKALGISLEEASASLGIMRDAGVSAETSGRALREGLNRLANPVKSVTDVMKELGIHTFTTGGHLNSLPSILGQLQASGITAEQALKLFGNAAGPGMFALVTKGKEGLEQLTASLKNSDGAAKHMADAMMTGLPGAMEKLRGSVETAWLGISKAIEPTVVNILGKLEGLADFVTNTVVPMFQGMPQWAQTATIGLLGIAAATGPLILGLGAVTKALGIMLESKLILGSINLIQDALFGLAKTIGGITVAAETSAVALLAMKAAMAGIIGISIVAVLVGARVALDHLNEGLAQQRKEFDMMKEASELAHRPITDLAEAQGILAAKVAGLSGKMVEGKRITIDQLQVWADAKDGVHAVSGVTTTLTGHIKINTASLLENAEGSKTAAKETDEEKKARIKATKAVDDMNTAVRALVNDAQLKWMNAVAETMAAEKKWKDSLLDNKIAVENLDFAEQARFEHLSHYNFDNMPGNNILQFLRPDQIQNKPFEDPDIWGDMNKSLQAQLRGIPMTLARAFEGGGDIMGAIKSIASQIGASLGAGIGEFFGGPAGAIIGQAIGSMAGSLVGLFTRGSEEARKMRKELGDLHTEFLNNHKGVDDLTAKAKMLGVSFDWVSSTEKNIANMRKQIELFDARMQALKETGDQALTGFISQASYLLKSISVEQVKLSEDLIENRIHAGLTRDELKSMGIEAVAAFSAAVVSGMSARDALAAIAPTLAGMKDAYRLLGVQVDDVVLKELMLQSSIVTKNPELLAAVDGLSSSFAALNTMHLLNADSFKAMQITGLEMYTRLQAATKEQGGATQEALGPMQGFLHAAEQAAKDLGVPLDDNTQRLIDQSKELGIWRDQGKTANELLLGAVQDLGAAMREVASSIKDIVGGLLGIPHDVTSNVHVHTTYTESRDNEDAPSRASGSPGTAFENWQGGTDVTLHGNETIVSKTQGNSLASMVGDAITRAGDTVASGVDYTRAILASNREVVSAIRGLEDTMPIFIRDGIRGAA